MGPHQIQFPKPTPNLISSIYHTHALSRSINADWSQWALFYLVHYRINCILVTDYHVCSTGTSVSGTAMSVWYLNTLMLLMAWESTPQKIQFLAVLWWDTDGDSEFLFLNLLILHLQKPVPNYWFLQLQHTFLLYGNLLATLFFTVFFLKSDLVLIKTVSNFTFLQQYCLLYGDVLATLLPVLYIVYLQFDLAFIKTISEWPFLQKHTFNLTLHSWQPCYQFFHFIFFNSLTWKKTQKKHTVHFCNNIL